MADKNNKGSKKSRSHDRDLDSDDIGESGSSNNEQSLDQEAGDAYPAYVPIRIFTEFSEAVAEYRLQKRRDGNQSWLRRIPGAPKDKGLTKATLRLDAATQNLLTAAESTIVTPSNFKQMIPVPSPVVDRLTELVDFKYSRSAREISQLRFANAQRVTGNTIASVGSSAFPVSLGIAVFEPTFGVPWLDAAFNVIGNNWLWIGIGGGVVAGFGEKVAGSGKARAKSLGRSPTEQKKLLSLASEILRDTSSHNRQRAISQSFLTEGSLAIDSGAKQLQPVYFNETHDRETFDQLIETLTAEKGASWIEIHDDLVARATLALDLQASILEHPGRRPFSILMEVFTNQSLLLQAETSQQKREASQRVSNAVNRLSEALTTLGISDLMNPNGSSGPAREQVFGDPQAPLDLRLVRFLGLRAAIRDLDSPLTMAPKSELKALSVPARREFASTAILDIANEALAALGKEEWTQNHPMFEELQPSVLEPNHALEQELSSKDRGPDDGLGTIA